MMNTAIAPQPPLLAKAPAPSGFPSYEAAVGVSVLITLSAASFIFKWLFDQTVRAWTDKFEDLEKRLEQAANQSNDSAILRKEFQVLEQRFTNLGGALQQNQSLIQDMQRDQLRLRQELSSDYLRREDWVRFSTTLEAKMDGLNRKLEDRFDTLLERINSK